MWNKIYPALLIISIITMSVLLYLPYSWLQSITAPRDVELQYRFYSNISWIFLLVSSLVMLLIGNVVLWLTQRAWAMWTTLLYFTVFMLAYTFWLESAFFNYRQTNNLETGIISWSPLVGVILIALTTVIVFFDQYLVKRMLAKTSGVTESVAQDLIEENSVVETIDAPKDDI